MDAFTWLQVSTNAEPVLCLIALAAIISRRQLNQFKFLAAYLCVRTLSFAIATPLIHLAGHQIEQRIAYRTYFYVYWLSYALETLLSLCILYQILRFVFEPHIGLQRAVSAIFRVLAVMAIVVAIVFGVGPHLTTTRFIMRFTTQLTELCSFLALGTLLLVILAIRPMGLSLRSRVFGVNLGLGVLAITDCVEASLTHTRQFVQILNMTNGIAVLSALAIWIIYFAQREPPRRDIQSPPASPLSRWNRLRLARSQGHAI
jgi:hypothetical protein